MRIATVIEISMTSLLTLAALWFGYHYNQQQQTRERIQGIVAAQQQCVDVQMRIPEWAKSATDIQTAKAVMNAVTYYTVRCRSAGFPIPKEQISFVSQRLRSLNISSIKRDVERFLDYTRSPKIGQPAAEAQNDLRIAREAMVETVSTEELQLSPGFTSLERFITGAAVAQRARVEAGQGVEWDSPFGPFRIDIEKALPPTPGDEEKSVTFDNNTQF